jgi:hypothetical protein
MRGCVMMQMGGERWRIMMLWPQEQVIGKRGKGMSEMASVIDMLGRRRDDS